MCYKHPEDWIVFRMMIVTNTHKWFIQEQDIVSVGKEIESENKPTLWYVAWAHQSSYH